MIRLELECGRGSFRLEAAFELSSSGAVLGHSGAGKTTLLEAILGLRRCRGCVELFGQAVLDSARGLDLPPERRGIGYVPQDALLFPHLSVLDNVAFGAGRLDRERGAEVAGLLDELEIAALRDRFPRHLSGGERRRVAIARAVASRPRLLLLDEPTQGLDLALARKVLGLIGRLATARELPMLLVTHRPDEALLAPAAVLLANGSVQAVGPSTEVLRSAVRHGWQRLANALTGEVIGHDPDGGVTVVREAGGLGRTVSIPARPDLSPGARLVLVTGAEEVLVSTRPPDGLSARNVIDGSIEELDEEEDGSVYVRIGDWWAHLTREAARALDLGLGRRAWYVVKTHSWRIVSES